MFCKEGLCRIQLGAVDGTVAAWHTHFATVVSSVRLCAAQGVPVHFEWGRQSTKASLLVCAAQRQAYNVFES